MEDETTWFHGGVPGLARGALLLPPSETGNAALLHYAREVAGASAPQRADRVYLTREYLLACVYAGMLPGGDVYEAVPEGAIEPDPDCALPGLSIQCARARVVRVARRGVPAAVALRALGGGR